MEILLGCIGLIVLTIVLLFYAPLAWGFVLYKYWYWFLLPIAPEFIIEITYINAVGIWLMTTFVKHITFKDLKVEEDDKYKNFITTLTMPWITLGIGWLYYHFLF